jgi:hypothetical protein
MGQSFTARRLQIFAALRARPAEFGRLDPSRLRCSLGTSPADPRVPVQVTPEAAQLVRGAAADLALLLSTGHRAFVPRDDFERLVMSEGYAALPTPAQSLGPSGGGVDLRSAARAGAEGHPALTGGILCAWMGPGGRGRSLTALWIDLLGQALDEMARSPEQEETPLLVALALHAELSAAAEAARDRLPSPPVERYLRSALGTGLWVAARTGVARAWRTAGRPEADPLLLRVEAAAAPGPLLGRGSRLGGATLYGCDLLAGLPRGDEAVARLSAGGDPDAAGADVAAFLLAEEEPCRRASLAVACGRLRALLLAGVPAAEEAGYGGRVAALRDLFVAPEGLSGALADEAGRKALRSAAVEAESLPGQAGAAATEAVRLLRAFRPREPAAAFGLTRDEACREYAAAVTAVLCDAAVERALAPARRSLAPRTGAEAEGGLEAEWAAGRLYRLSTRGGPILRTGPQHPHGHLFVDVKDFTRRTGLLGQATMAEFLRTEFYGPILGAAKRFYRGMSHLDDRGGVSLNNLLGDAISLTGDIESLVALASEIRALLAQYEERLARQVSSEAVARHAAAIEERLGAQLGRARREAALAREAQARAAPGSPQQAEALARGATAAAEEARLARERERALARARGEGLEAGIFISHGAAPLVVVIDDEVFGHNRVAIAEKINESARGTARAPQARGRADAERDEARRGRGGAPLEHAWSVFVDHPLTVTLPAEAERAAVLAARAGDVQAALRAVAGPVRTALQEAARGLGPEEPGELYNSGAALSQEALDAFLEAARAERLVREVLLDPVELPEELRARWWFGSRPQALVATFHRDGTPAELFRRVGRAAFKGMGDVAVWELCAEGGAAAALWRACGKAWLGET